MFGRWFWKVYDSPEQGMSDGVAMEAVMLSRLDHGAWVHGYWFWMQSLLGEAAIVCVENVEVLLRWRFRRI
jgi:hypothetical protein